MSPRLDVAMARMRAHDPRPWGARPVLVPCASLVGLVALTGAVAAVLSPDGATARLVVAAVLDAGVYAALAVAVVLGGAQVSRRYGGFGNAFGLRRPVRRDLVWVAAGIGLVIASRLVVSLLAAAVLGQRALRQGQNLRLDHPGVGQYVVLGVVACVLAPVVEESIFRGLLLRTFMRRVGFWPAALASSALFGLFHTYEVPTLAGAVVLALVTGSLGLTNCLLVRWTERLDPGIVVHAVANGVALLALAALH